MLRRNYLSVSSGAFMGAIGAIFNHSVGFWKDFQFSDVKIKKIKLGRTARVSFVVVVICLFLFNSFKEGEAMLRIMG